MSIRTAVSFEDAARERACTYVAGATDLMPLFKNGVRDDAHLVLLRDVRELGGIAEEDGCIVIGAGVTLAELAESPLVRSALPALAQAALAVASPQIRALATLGGNVMQDRRCIYFNQSRAWRAALPPCYKTGGSVCHQIPNSPVCRALYYSDTATALICYDAEVVFAEDGAEKRGRVEALVARHAEANGLACARHLPVLLKAFRIPRPPAGERSGFYKYAMRTSIDFPLINFALRCGPAGARLVAGAVAPRPCVLEETAALLHAGASDDEVAAACEAELRRLAAPVREALISPAMKRSLYRHVRFLLPLRRGGAD